MGPDEFQLFDWRRIFVGDLPPSYMLEMVFRTTWMYLWALLISRLLGKRAVGEMTSFDHIMVIAIGSATGDPMFMIDVPLLHGMLVLTVVMLLERVIARWSQRSPKVERLVESTPTPLVHDGRILYDRLREERMSMGELLSLLRLNGVRDVGEVERVWLEPTGRLSVFLRPDHAQEDAHSTWPPRDVEDSRV